MKRISSDGFSLVEMLVALLIASVAISSLAGGFSVRHRALTANDMARRLAVDAAALGAQAVLTGATRQLIVDVKSRAVFFETNKLEVPENLTLSVKTGAELIAQDYKGSILFFADGTSSGGEIALSDSSAGTATVRINWITGAVQIDRPQL
jgi:general secretion pathway protein H